MDILIIIPGALGMSIKLNKDLINIADLLKIKSSVISWFNLINFYGDNSLKRKAKNIEIFTTDQFDKITLVDDGEIPSDFIIEKGLELNDIKQFAPYIFFTSRISDLINISYFTKNQVNKTLSLDLSQTSNTEIKILTSKINDPFLKNNMKERNNFFSVSFKLRDNQDYYKFLKKINHNFTFRYHKILKNRNVRITSLPERQFFRAYDPLFENFEGTRKGQTVKFRGNNYKLDLRYFIIPRNITRELVSGSCPSGNLDSCSGIFFYNKKNILINRPSYFDLERRLNLPQNIKERNLKYVKLEINAIDNQISDIEDINKFLQDKFMRKKIIELLELAAREVPDQIHVSEPNVSDEFKRIIIKRVDRMLEENKSKDDCLEELTYMFPKSDQKILIEKILNDR